MLQEIRTWAEGDDTRHIFWLNGLAGTGKSTIARTIAREYYEKRSLGASFFFTRGGGDLANAGKFFPTIAMQLVNQLPSLKKLLSASLEKHQDVANLSLNDQWNHLVINPISNLKPGFHEKQLLIIIDALDECDGDDDVRAILRLLSEVHSLTAVQLRILITSRPETPVRLGFDKMASILHHDLILDNISRDIVDRDIFTFFKTQFSEISKEFNSIPPDWPGLERLNALVKKSNGLFIYAVTIYRFIKEHDQWSPEDLLTTFLPNESPDRPRKRRRKQAVPQTSPFIELDKIYTQILEHSLKRINSQDQEQIAGEAREIISTIAILYQPQSLETLSCILDMDRNTIELRLKHLRSLLSIPDNNNSPIRTLHPSFRDFLFDNERCISNYFSSKESTDHIRLSELCFDILSKYLKEDMCKVRRSGISVLDIEKAAIQQAIPPEVEYSCIYWVQHILKSDIELSEDHWINEFLRRHILHWFEALSWIGRLSDGIHGLSALELKISVGFISVETVRSNKY